MLITAETTVDEVEESLSHLVTAARQASDARIYDVMHKRIDTHLGVWEVLNAVTR